MTVDETRGAGSGPQSWTASTSPSRYASWVEDQEVFMQPPRAIGSDSVAPTAHSLSPTRPRRRRQRITTEIRMLIGAGFAGLAVAGAVALWLHEPSDGAGKTTTTAAVAVEPEVVAPEPPKTEPPVISRRELITARRSVRTTGFAKATPTIGSAPTASKPAATNDDDGEASSSETEPTAVGSAEPSPSVQPVAAADAPAEDTDDEPAPDEPDLPVTSTATGPPGDFDQDAARRVMFAAASNASGCARKNGPTGRGHVVVTVSPSGSVGSVSVSPPFSGTAVGRCAASAFRAVTVPPFTGASVTLQKSFQIRALKKSAKTAKPSVGGDSDDSEPTKKPKRKKRRKRRKRIKKRRGKHRIDLT